MMEITAEQARAIRCELGLSQKEMSLALGVGEDMVRRYERGRCHVSGAIAVVYQLLATNSVTPERIWRVMGVLEECRLRPTKQSYSPEARKRKLAALPVTVDDPQTETAAKLV
jgi:transcriptional regulator with XRE-family HTH domain